MLNQFDIFLIGTLRRGDSPIKHLPEDVLIMIANSMSDSTLTFDIVRKGWRYGIERHIALGTTFTDFANHSCESGKLDLVIEMWRRFPNSLNQSGMTHAAYGGHRHVMEWLHDVVGLKYDYMAVVSTGARGHRETFIWLVEKIGKLDKSILSAVAQHADILRWAAYRVELTQSAMDYAVIHKNLESIKFIHSYFPEYLTWENRVRCLKVDGLREWVRSL